MERAADLLAAGELIIFYFNGTYAFLCDADQMAPARKLFGLKKRPLTQTLSLIVNPIHLPEFVDPNHPAFSRFPLGRAMALQKSIHALGLILPADLGSAPQDILQGDTILNIWTEYEEANRPLARLTQLIRKRGLRACKGASTNLSTEPTYNTIEQVLEQFDGYVPLILDNPWKSPPARRKSTTILNLTSATPTIVRLGNVPVPELQQQLDQVGFGKLAIAPNVKRL
ncbi:MAG: Sua5/YciO/YrdC/YwlC family protein [Chloroflexota bacterium]